MRRYELHLVWDKDDTKTVLERVVIKTTRNGCLVPMTDHDQELYLKGWPCRIGWFDKCKPIGGQYDRS